jgi:uncharacterized protein (DUF1499 family)
MVRKVTALSILPIILAACAGERPTNLGVQNGVLAACPASPNCVSSRAADEGHYIAPLVFSDAPDVAFARLKQVLMHRSDTRIIEEQPGYLRAEFHTTFFVDDGEFLLDPVQRVIQVRSASRLGYSDLGKNRSRLEEVRRQFLAAEGKR